MCSHGELAFAGDGSMTLDAEGDFQGEFVKFLTHSPWGAFPSHADKSMGMYRKAYFFQPV